MVVFIYSEIVYADYLIFYTLLILKENPTSAWHCIMLGQTYTPSDLGIQHSLEVNGFLRPSTSKGI